MLSYPDNIIYLLLIKKLNGINDLAKYILDIKNDKYYIDFEKSKKETIERNFFNWLTHDSVFRVMLDTKEIRLEELDNDIYNDYKKNLNGLGLDIQYRREKSLSKCFQSQWWKTTSKNTGDWKIIHKIIKSEIIIYRAKTPFYDVDIIEDWNELTNVESKDIINTFYLNFVYMKNRFMLEDITCMFLDMDSSHPILIE